MRPKRATCANPLYGLIFPPCALLHPSLHVWAGVLPCHSHLVTTGKGLLQWNSVLHNSPLKILTTHHLALLSNTKTPEALVMGVCSSAEQPFEQGIAEPENDLNSDDPLKKEPFEDDVTGENSDSSSAATADG